MANDQYRAFVKRATQKNQHPHLDFPPAITLMRTWGHKVFHKGATVLVPFDQGYTQGVIQAYGKDANEDHWLLVRVPALHDADVWYTRDRVMALRDPEDPTTMYEERR